MKILFLALVLAWPIGCFAKCNFKSEKKEPEYQFVKTSVGPAMLQWAFWIGKNVTDGGLYLWVHIVEDGNRGYKLNNTDKVILEFEDGEKVTLSPESEVKGKVYFDGSIVTTTYPARLKADRAVIEKLSKTNLAKVYAVVDSRNMDREVKDRTTNEIKEAAICVLAN